MQKRILTRILRVWGGMLPPSYCKPFGRIAQNSAPLWLRAFPQTSEETSILKKADMFFRIR